VSVAGPENLRTSKTFLAEEREKLGDRRFRQGYRCEFAGMSDAMFSDEDIESRISDHQR
jgi:hypothetical protein